ncbi:uncharacterized protein LOC737824 [Pan troglodytes]|uniref:uncharacterized protein LOC737824 n=1 Tax=Pan troglodytes TaxID=9598 RepID=UPI003013AED0
MYFGFSNGQYQSGQTTRTGRSPGRKAPTASKSFRGSHFVSFEGGRMKREKKNTLGETRASDKGRQKRGLEIAFKFRGPTGLQRANPPEAGTRAPLRSGSEPKLPQPREWGRPEKSKHVQKAALHLDFHVSPPLSRLRLPNQPSALSPSLNQNGTIRALAALQESVPGAREPGEEGVGRGKRGKVGGDWLRPVAGAWSLRLLSALLLRRSGRRLRAPSGPIRRQPAPAGRRYWKINSNLWLPSQQSLLQHIWEPEALKFDNSKDRTISQGVEATFHSAHLTLLGK